MSTHPDAADAPTTCACTHDDATQLAAFRAECDKVGVPYDAEGLVRHHRANAGLAAHVDAWTLSRWKTRAEKAEAMIESVRAELVRGGTTAAAARQAALGVLYDGPNLRAPLTPVPAEPVAPSPRIHNPGKHERIMDDGAAYCGWAGDDGIHDGCGWAWPCPTVKGKSEREPAAEEEWQSVDLPVPRVVAEHNAPPPAPEPEPAAEVMTTHPVHIASPRTLDGGCGCAKRGEEAFDSEGCYCDCSDYGLMGCDHDPAPAAGTDTEDPYTGLGTP